MADPIRQLLSQTSYVADGVNTVWNFSFSGGYLDKSHVKAKYLDAMRVEHQLAVSPAMFIGAYQLSITPPVAEGYELTIYRDTPKNLPLVDFIDAASLTEASLDLSARQAVFVAAESSDLLVTTIASTSQIATSLAATEAAAGRAAASEANALDSMNYMKGRNYGPLADDPTLDPLGAAPTLGDEYFNTTVNLKRVYRASGWYDYEASSMSYANSAWQSEQDAAGSAGAALTSQKAAEDAKALAEAARDSANILVKVVSSTAEGISITISGQAFGMLDLNAKELVVYRNLGGSANEDYRIKLSIFFNALFPSGYSASRTGYLHTWLDAANRLLLGIKIDGSLWSKGINLTAQASDASTALVLAQAAGFAAGVVQKGHVRSRFLHAYTDSTNRLLGGFLLNGELEVKGVNHSQAIADVATLAESLPLLRPSTDIYLFGDSLTEGAGTNNGLSVGVQLAALYSAEGKPRTVFSSGYGGQTGASILARLGAAPSLVTLPVGASGFPEIPASGGVNVSVTANPLAYANATLTKSMVGKLAGIPGTLTKAGTTGQYSFSRTTAGSTVVTDVAIPFEPSTEQYRYWTAVCWIGTNDMTSKSAAEILTLIDCYLDFQAPVQKRRVIVMPTFDSLSASVGATQARYAELLALVKARYPYEYVDTLSLLQRNHNGSATDLADIAAGLPPRSLLFSDRYHFNVTGYNVLACDIKRILDSKGF